MNLQFSDTYYILLQSMFYPFQHQGTLHVLQFYLLVNDPRSQLCVYLHLLHTITLHRCNFRLLYNLIIHPDNKVFYLYLSLFVFLMINSFFDEGQLPLQSNS